MIKLGEININIKLDIASSMILVGKCGTGKTRMIKDILRQVMKDYSRLDVFYVDEHGADCKEVKELRKLTEETKDIQEKSLTYINDLYNKLVDVREYAKNLQLKEENEKKVSEQLDSINSDIQELEIRLKKDIPELDKSLDINNFR
mgnify:CR=1 FL=1